MERMHKVKVVPRGGKFKEYHEARDPKNSENLERSERNTQAMINQLEKPVFQEMMRAATVKENPEVVAAARSKRN